MEYLLLPLIVVAAWLLFAPKRMLRRAGDWPLFKPALVGVVALIGWMAVTSLMGTPRGGNGADVPIERRTDQTQIYARGDDQLRALLSQ